MGIEHASIGGSIMKKNMLILLQAAMVIGMILFVHMRMDIPEEKKIAEEKMVDYITSKVDTEAMERRDSQAMKRFLSLDPSSYEYCIYWKAKDTMTADEIVIVRFKGPEQASDFAKKMETRIQDQLDVFDKYAPKQADLLRKATVETYTNYGVYIVSSEADKLQESFEKKIGIE